jgi:MFS family permease
MRRGGAVGECAFFAAQAAAAQKLPAIRSWSGVPVVGGEAGRLNARMAGEGSMAGPETRSEFVAGWPAVLSAMLGVGLGLSPVGFYTIGVFAPVLAKNFGWSFGAIFFGITVQTFAAIIFAPLTGALADRIGARPVALVSTVLFALAFMGFALGDGSLTLYYATWAMLAVVGCGTLPMTWTRAINRRFERRKGMALGIALMGTGLFGFFSKPLTAWLIADFGWRAAYVGIGLLPLVVALPVGLALFYEPAGPVAAKAGVPLAGLSLEETLRSWRFWLLGAALLPISFAITGPIPNMENILKGDGFSGASITDLTSLIGLSAMAGRLAGGFLLDLFWAPAVAAVILASPLVSIWLLMQSSLSAGEAAAAICLIGFAVGVEYDLIAYLVARYFGMRSYTTIYGILYMCFGCGAGFAPFIFGWGFDRAHSYNPVLAAAAGLLLVSVLALLTLGRYRFATSATLSETLSIEEATSPAAP